MQASTSALKILLVEDNVVNQKIATKLLELIGHSCELAESGERCLEMTLEKRYDLIFLDVEMPGINGFETLRRLREHEVATKSLPSHVVACTAFSLSGHREKLLAAGMNDYLTKPLKRELIKNLIEEYVATRDGSSPT